MTEIEAKQEVMKLVSAGLSSELLPFGSSDEKTQLKAGIVAWMTLRKWQKMKPHDERLKLGTEFEANFCLDLILNNDNETMPDISKKNTDWVLKEWPERIKEIGANVIAESTMVLPSMRNKEPLYWNIRIAGEEIVVAGQHKFHDKEPYMDEVLARGTDDSTQYIEASFSCHWMPSILKD